MTPGERAELTERRDTLTGRLEKGYGLIEQGLADGRNVTAWEDAWESLLREYERISDALAEAENPHTDAEIA